jgi:hypothetical protein
MSQTLHSFARTTHLIRKEIGVTYGSKHMIARARPGDGKSAWDSFGNAEKRSDGSFPSEHASIALVAVTPFAKEYDAPWLHGVAVLGSAGRAGDRKQWVSDTVPAVFSAMRSAVGYGNLSAKSGSRLTINSGSKELSVSC